MFNCTGSRSGVSFLESMLKNTGERLAVHESGETLGAFFDTVIFCTNVAYADGHFKRGLSFFLLPLTSPTTSR